MSDPNENWLVKLYYTNFIFFAIIAAGADSGLVWTYIWARYPYFYNNLPVTIYVYVSFVIIGTK